LVVILDQSWINRRTSDTVFDSMESKISDQDKRGVVN
jgi:hypothetical protein